MTLEQIGAGIDFVSDTIPSNPKDGDVFLDTSLAPPEVKVFDASVGAFIRPQTAQNLDLAVSESAAPVQIRGEFEVDNASFLSRFDFSSEDNKSVGVAFIPDGSAMYMVGNNTAKIYQYVLSTAFDVTTASLTSSFDVSSQDGVPAGITFNPDGSAMFIPGAGASTAFQYVVGELTPDPL
jgi:hypothetical protein